jgi:ElaB/YqjD/DUF883 family membrane-anchored ribosome-binding protein
MTQGIEPASFHELRHDLGRLGNDLIRLDAVLRRVGHCGTAGLREGVERGTEGVTKTADRIRREVTSLTNAIDRDLDARPPLAAVSALALGIVIGLLLGRRGAPLPEPPPITPALREPS